jgi:uncharacterized protein YecT (DUF1311 family)
MRAFALAALALAATATSASAAGIDCGKAQSAVEKAICAGPKLKAADDAMSTVYDKLHGAADVAGKEALRLSQRRWISQREGCAEPDAADITPCIAQSTAGRTAVLTARPETGPGDGADLTPWFVQKEGKTGAWDIGFDLVRFAKPETAGEALFNRQAEALLAPALIENSTLGTATEKVRADRIYAYAVSLTPTFASKRFISALAEGYENRGGAHPNQWSRAINVDLAGGRIASFGDLFPREAAGIFAKLCTDQLIATRRARTQDAGQNLDEGADEVILPHVRDLENWSIHADKATILFDAYLIGPYAEGPYSCDLGTEVIKSQGFRGVGWW